jgi:hypothetical protein
MSCVQPFACQNGNKVRRSTSSGGASFQPAYDSLGVGLRIAYDADKSMIYFGYIRSDGTCAWMGGAFTDAAVNGGRKFFVSVYQSSGKAFKIATKNSCPAEVP